MIEIPIIIGSFNCLIPRNPIFRYFRHGSRYSNSDPHVRVPTTPFVVRKNPTSVGPILLFQASHSTCHEPIAMYLANQAIRLVPCDLFLLSTFFVSTGQYHILFVLPLPLPLFFPFSSIHQKVCQCINQVPCLATILLVAYISFCRPLHINLTLARTPGCIPFRCFDQYPEYLALLRRPVLWPGRPFMPIQVRGNVYWTLVLYRQSDRA